MTSLGRARPQGSQPPSVDEVRPLDAGDLPAVLEMWRELMARGSRVDPRWRLHTDAPAHLAPWARQTWLRRDPFPHAWIARHDGLAVGWIEGHPVQPNPLLDTPPCARIGNIRVSPAHRGLGLGRALVEAFARGARDAGYPSIDVGTLTRDEAAVRFWKHLGFVPMQVTMRRE